MHDVAIVSSVYGGYDTLQPTLPQEGLSVDWVFVTDMLPENAYDWRVVLEPKPHLHPNRAAKRAKLVPWEYTDAPMSVWIDGNFRVQSTTFAREALAFAHPIAQFNHPWRQCLFHEAICTMAVGKYADQVPIIEAQSEHYRDMGHPDEWGLWATGVIARRHTKEVVDLGWQWLAEVHTWSIQDQVSQPYVLNRIGLRPELFPGDYFSSPWLAYEGHRKYEYTD